MHYKRWRNNGDPTITKKTYRQAPQCSVADCLMPPLAKGFCTNHYALMRRNGEPVRTRLFTGVYLKDGYRYVRVGHRHYEPEHRLVIERLIGRALGSHEQIHHIDEDTLNNSPSNLQIVSRAEHRRIHAAKKLTAEDVVQIRAMAAGGLTHPAIARRFNVSRAAVLSVVNRRSWQHVP